MAYFINHRLIKNNDGGYIAELYLDQQLSEFSLDFLGLARKDKATDKLDNLEKTVKSYIREKLPGINVTVANIMIGSLLIASIPISNIYASKENLQILQPFEIQEVYEEDTQQTQEISEDAQISEEQKTETSVPDQKEVDKQDEGILEESSIVKSPEVAPKPVQPEKSPIISTKPAQPDKSVNIISNPADILVLVNKFNSLPSSYVPNSLVVPNIAFSFKEYDQKKLMRQDAAAALEEMFKAAKSEGINLYAVSGYRSYSTQSSIFASNVSKYGFESANQFSAKPGQSEHQTGLAMDITCASIGYNLTQSFGETKEGKWVRDNANKYGFIIRYQQGKESITGYQYEPWHLRFVGKEAAKEIKSQNVTLEQYLGRI